MWKMLNRLDGVRGLIRNPAADLILFPKKPLRPLGFIKTESSFITGSYNSQIYNGDLSGEDRREREQNFRQSEHADMFAL